MERIFCNWEKKPASHPTAKVDRLRPVGRLCFIKHFFFFVSLPLNHGKRLNEKEHRLLTRRLPVVVNMVSLRCFDVTPRY